MAVTAVVVMAFMQWVFVVVCNLGLIAAQDVTKGYVQCHPTSKKVECTFHMSKSTPPADATAWGLVKI